MINVVLIGAGSHGTTQHAPSLRHFVREHAGKINLAAACDIDRGKGEHACETFGFEKSFTSLEALFNEIQVDAAIVVLPHRIIAPVIEKILTHRIPLLIEKPLGANLTDARTLIEAIDRSGSPVMVSLNRRFDPGLHLALDWVKRQGPIRYVHGSMLRHKRIEPEFLWTTGIHLIDLLCYLAGPLALLREDAAGSNGGKVAWYASTLRGIQNSIVASFEILPDCGRREERFRIAGEDYCVDVWTGTTHPWRVEAYQDGELKLNRQSPPAEPEFLRNGAYAETAAFLEAVLEHKPLPGPSPQDAMPATELIAQWQKTQNNDL